MIQIIRLLLLALLCFSSVALAETEHERQAKELSNTIMSPFCPGRTLSSCPSTDARNLRIDVKRMFQFGKSRSEIEAELEQRFPGFNFGGVPEAEGFGIVAWSLPAVFVLLLLAVIAILLSGMRRVSEVSPQDEVDPELEARVNAELERRLK